MKRPPGKQMLERARELRRKLTPAEKRLWAKLRAGRFGGHKFRRQMWLCGYIADFACVEAKLVIEADGSQHLDDQDYDERRSKAFARKGFRTLRFWNNEVLENLEGVLIAIGEALPSPSLQAAPSALLPSPSHPAGPGGPLPLPLRERGL